VGGAGHARAPVKQRTAVPRRYPDADAALGRSLRLRLRPDGNAAALSGLAALRTVQRRYVEAQDLARRAVALSPDDLGVRGTLADAASGLGRTTRPATPWGTCWTGGSTWPY